jgi:hypothetical protein
MTERIVGTNGELIPFAGIGKWGYQRHFHAHEYAELAADYPMLTAVEEWFIAAARRSAAGASLTVLKEYPFEWVSSQFDDSRLLRVAFKVIYEPQADDMLIRSVGVRLYRDRDLYPGLMGGMPDPFAFARAAVEAVRDLGRLTAAVPRPDGIPE